MIGLEMEDFIDHSEFLSKFEVAEIIESKPHPDADKLQICTVRTKNETLQIVCGASNARTGLKVVLAKVGTLIPNGNFKIKATKIRGIDSFGMMCSKGELGLPEDGSEGIIELPQNAIIGKQVASYLGADDPVFFINITPNRADALGVYGIARDLAASGLGRLKDQNIITPKSSFTSNYKVSVNNSKTCPLFTMREIRGVNNTQSPNWLKNLLLNIGVEPISAIVDITNYICYSFGQPMHAYDATKINSGLKVDVLLEEAKFLALNEQEYNLPKDSLVISDSGEIQCLAGIIGGQKSACSKNTNSIILEAAIFDASTIAKCGRSLHIDTDSRYRFERNVDQEFTTKALDIATNLIIEICGGESSEAIIEGHAYNKPREILFSAQLLTKKTNISLENIDIINILSKLGFICSEKDDQISVTIPSWRYDVSIPEDLVEEVVRIYGYENIPQTPLPNMNATKIIPYDHKRMSDIKRLLATSGYTEITTWSFMDSVKAKHFTKIEDGLTLQNPISSELDYMRPSILPNILTACANNLNRSFNNFSLFELGPIFNDTSDKVVNNACGVRVGKDIENNVHGQRDVDVFDIKADIAMILEFYGLDINKCQFKTNAPEYYHPTRSASINLGKKTLGYFGQVHPIIAKKMDVKTNAFAFEINIEALPISKAKFGKKSEYKISDYQAIKRDYAFIVDQELAVLDLINCVKNSDKKLIKDVILFDIYNGENIQQGRKSVALSVNIQDDNKTLSKDDIETINTKILDNVTGKFNAVLRDC
ncbi:MAG: hypothetical protein DGJ47_000087 [Rickettsiaceae bacterium]